MENCKPGREFLDEVRLRMRQSMESPETDECERRVAFGLFQFREAAAQARTLSTVVGSSPPQPDSMRARIGMWLVRIVQQTLFWYTPQIISYQAAATDAMETQLALFEAICLRLERAEARTAALQLELNRLTGQN